MINHYRRVDFAEAKKKASLNGTGWGMLGCSVECLLVGYFDVGLELLQKANTFLSASIELDEKPFLSEAIRSEELALCGWLLEGRHNLKGLKAAVLSRERTFSQERSHCKTDVQLSLPSYLDAGEYEALLRRYESVGLKKPANLQRIQGEGTMSYVLARNRLGVDYSAEEIETALHTFLKRKVPQWLGSGLYTSAAQWMKIAFWKEGDDPVATLLRCYDYLPGLKPPKYPDKK